MEPKTDAEILDEIDGIVPLPGEYTPMQELPMMLHMIRLLLDTRSE